MTERAGRGWRITCVINVVLTSLLAAYLTAVAVVVLLNNGDPSIVALIIVAGTHLCFAVLGYRSVASATDRFASPLEVADGSRPNEPDSSPFDHVARGKLTTVVTLTITSATILFLFGIWAAISLGGGSLFP